jgi:hypothetical protein
MGAALMLAAGAGRGGPPDGDATAPNRLRRVAKLVELDGEAVSLADAVRRDFGLELSDEAWDDVVAFRTHDRRLLPIVPTASGLVFYRDSDVRNRPMRIQARVFDGFEALEIVDRFPLVDGKPYELYYWCEICSIKMHHLQPCECCQGPVERREVPVGETYQPRNR